MVTGGGVIGGGGAVVVWVVTFFVRVAVVIYLGGLSLGIGIGRVAVVVGMIVWYRQQW